MNNLFLLLLVVSLIGLVVGLVKPSYTRLKSRREVGFLFGGAIIIFFILVGVASPSAPTSNSTAENSTSQVADNSATTPSASTTANAPAPTATVANPTTTNTLRQTPTSNKIVTNAAAPNQVAPSQSTPPPTPAISATCSPAQSTLTTGQTGIWTAQVFGGTGSYTYSWAGTDGLSGTGRSTSLTYSTTGTKSASVDIISGGQSVNQNCNGVITVSSPASAQAGQTNSQNTAPASNETVSQQNAVRAAQQYLSYTAFSHDGLVAQLEYDQFSSADAEYGADNVDANWNDEAAKAAQQYISYTAFSCGSLISQLEYDKFTQAQAQYGADSVGLCN